MIPWYDGANPSMQERINQIEASRWVKRNMAKISKKLGVNSYETKDTFLDLLMQIENGRPNKPTYSYENQIISPGKKYEREKKVPGIWGEVQRKI